MGVGRDDFFATQDRTRAGADRHGIHVGRKHAPRPAHSTGQFQDEIPNFAAEAGEFVRAVVGDCLGGCAGLFELLGEELGDRFFFAAAAGDGHELEEDVGRLFVGIDVFDHGRGSL